MLKIKGIIMIVPILIPISDTKIAIGPISDIYSRDLP